MILCSFDNILLAFRVEDWAHPLPLQEKDSFPERNVKIFLFFSIFFKLALDYMSVDYMSVETKLWQGQILQKPTYTCKQKNLLC